MHPKQRRWPLRQGRKFCSSVARQTDRNLFFIVIISLLATLYLHSQLIDLNQYVVHAVDEYQALTDGTQQQDNTNTRPENSKKQLVDSASTSHLIMIDGWPNVSQMWPTLNTSQSDDQHQQLHKVPFIYSDKASPTDYYIIFPKKKEDTVMDINGDQSKTQVNLSFEYYFDHGSGERLPAIRVEVNRQQFKYLSGDNSTLKQWNTFNELLTYEKPIAEDWLKILLLNRKTPSMVAIRKLKLEFLVKDIWDTPEETDSTSEDQKQPDKPMVFTCYNSSHCDWKIVDGIEWSLARMPPASNKVKLGYYYNSNLAGSNNSEKILNIYLAETNSTTKTHQSSDQCIDLALYVSGTDAKLRMIRLDQENNDPEKSCHSSRWKKGNTLITWSATTLEDNRLSRSSRTSISDDGWIEETICFNEFFGTKSCGSCQCAIGFEMISTQKLNSDVNDAIGTNSEIVVAVALLTDKVENVPIKTPKASLNTWQRPEINPKLNWKFRPTSYWKIEDYNVTMKNIFDQASFTIASDWLEYSPNLNLMGSLVINTLILNKSASIDEQTIFSLKEAIVDSNFSSIYENVISLPVHIHTDATDQVYNLLNNNNNLSSRFDEAQLEKDKIFKVLLTMNVPKLTSSLSQLLDSNQTQFDIKLTNVSISDRCYPNPCFGGACSQNGTNIDDWQCKCPDEYFGRTCNFGNWCDYPHVTNANLTGNKYCSDKLEEGYKCTNMEVTLDESIDRGEGKTFHCSCKDNYYLSDKSKCKKAHKCNSLMCSSLGKSCDTTKPFNEAAPCQCDESQGWLENPKDKNKCKRKQCYDKGKDCDDAHICLPTVGKNPICKCGDKFRLETDEKDGKKMCKSMACILPSLNDCDQICQPNDADLQKPYTCACHSGFKLSNDQRTCQPVASKEPVCNPACQGDNQICTNAGCKCKQGYFAEDETVEYRNNPTMKYTKSVKCVNVCSTSYAENPEQFAKIEAVCPLGLCDKTTFRCACSDKSHDSVKSNIYEPRFNMAIDQNGDNKENVSPLCRLRRVCEKGSNSYKICTDKGAICKPDYSRASMFDCECPTWTVKSEGNINEFKCEPKCARPKERNECLRQQGVCKLVDKDNVGCDCEPGFIYNQTDKKCYIANYSYRFHLLVVNKYYEPKSRYHNDDTSNSQLSSESQQQRLEFLTDHNQCTALIPRSILEDHYDNDLDPFLDTIEECNARIRDNIRTYKLNSDLVGDIRQSLRQKLYEPFNVTIKSGTDTCLETDTSGEYLNCTIYLQSNTPVEKEAVEAVFTKCDPNGVDNRYCWIKPKILLKKLDDTQDTLSTAVATTISRDSIAFEQIVPCELDGFCGKEAQSVKLDNRTSLCSCKCPDDVETIDVKELLPLHIDSTQMPLKQICAPSNNCLNSSFCLHKPGSTCHYDVHSGSQCKCIPHSKENKEGNCIEVPFSEHNTLIIFVVLLGTALIVSVIINFVAAAKSGKFIGNSKEYPLSVFTTTHRRNATAAGLSNPAFIRD